jgi:hypothetical protein
MLFKEIQQIFNNNECTLLTTKEEIEELMKEKFQSHIKVEFTAKCGHKNKVVLTNFVLRGTGIICKDCVKKNNKDRTNVLTENNINAASLNNCMENTGYHQIIKLLEDKFIIKKTNEGCKADFIIKPKNVPSDENKWLMIQLKTTQKEVHTMYSFGLPTKYDDMIMVCYCIDENKFWIMRYEDIAHLKYKLNISMKSKYNKYLTNETNIIDKFNKYYETTKLFELEYCLKPTNIYQQREQIYRRTRELKLFNIKFEYPDIEQCYYDFTINDKKIQEKVCGKCIDRDAYTVSLYRCNGISYKKGMNEFYWLHMDKTDIFYIIPETILIEQKKIEDTIQFKTKPMFRIYINKEKMWYNKYKYDYNKLDLNLIYNMFY